MQHSLKRHQWEMAVTKKREVFILMFMIINLSFFLGGGWFREAMGLKKSSLFCLLFFHWPSLWFGSWTGTNRLSELAFSTGQHVHVEYLVEDYILVYLRKGLRTLSPAEFNFISAEESEYKKNAMCVESIRKGHIFQKRILFTRSVNRFQGKC